MPRCKSRHALVGRSVVAELSEAINLDEIAVGLPRRIHEVTARQVAKPPGRIALVEDGASWSYRDLDQRVSEVAIVLSSLRPQEVGELHVRGRNVMLGYYRAPELTAKVIDSEGLVQYRRSGAFRRRLPVHCRPHQGN